MVFNKASARTILVAAACISLAACQTTAPPSSEASIDAALQRAATKASTGGHTSQSVTYLEKIYKRNSEDPQAALNFARTLREQNSLLRASTILKPFANDKEAGVDVLAEYAAIQLEQGNYETSERFARKALVKDETSALANHYLGIALDAQGAHEQANTAFRKALDLWEGDPTNVMNNLALNLTSMGELTEAAEILERAQAIAPHKKEIERNLRIVRTLQQSTGYKIPKPKAKPSNN